MCLAKHHYSPGSFSRKLGRSDVHVTNKQFSSHAIHFSRWGWGNDFLKEKRKRSAIKESLIADRVFHHNDKISGSTDRKQLRCHSRHIGTYMQKGQTQSSIQHSEKHLIKFCHQRSFLQSVIYIYVRFYASN